MALRDLFTPYQQQQREVSAASLRAPLRGELLVITVTTASKRFAVPVAWRGSLVRIQADGGDVYIQVSTLADAAADIAARAQEAGNPIALTPSAAVTGCFKIVDGQWLDVPMPSESTGTFALIGSAACCARTHLSES